MIPITQALDPTFGDTDQVQDSGVDCDVTSSSARPSEVPRSVAAMSDLEAQMAALKVSDHFKDKLTRLLAASRTLTAKENLILTLR